MDHPLQLKYQRNYSIIINDCDVSLFIILITESAITDQYGVSTLAPLS